MALTKKLTIKVNGKKATLSKKVYLYLGDGGITLNIEILENDTNMVVETGAVRATVCILTAANKVIYDRTCGITDGLIDFALTTEFINEIAEEGTHLLQIHLYDAEGEIANRYTIPPVSLTLLKPICDIASDPDTP